MAQAMLLMPGVLTSNSVDLKRDALLKLQIQKIKPKSSSSSLLFFSPLPSSSSSSSSSSSPLKTVALFKSKPKTPPKKVEKPKLKVEDGLFGTSGGIGFTKENELFVGRVAMLGFADIAKGQSKEEAWKLMKKCLVAPMMAMVVALVPGCYTTPASMAASSIDAPRAAAVFRRSCIGCHDTGGNIIQPGATLFSNDLKKNGVDSEDDIFNVTYYGKGRMPGFGEKCMPRGQCTFGPRLQDEDIRLLAQFVKLQADQGWPNIDIYGQ